MRKFTLLSFHLNVNIITKGFSHYSTIVILIHRINVSRILHRCVLDFENSQIVQPSFFFLRKLLSQI